MISFPSLRITTLCCACNSLLAATMLAQSSTQPLLPPPPRPLPAQNNATSSAGSTQAAASTTKSSDKTIIEPAKPAPAQEKPVFVTAANVRNEPRSGFSVAVFGGASLAQNLDGNLQGTVRLPGPPPTTTIGNFPAKGNLHQI